MHPADHAAVPPLCGESVEGISSQILGASNRRTGRTRDVYHEPAAQLADMAAAPLALGPLALHAGFIRKWGGDAPRYLVPRIVPRWLRS